MRYPAILSCAKNGKDHLVVALNDDGRCEWTFLLPGRGHGLAVRDDMAIVVGRRPSDWALILDRASGELRSVIPPPDGMTFTGHVVWKSIPQAGNYCWCGYIWAGRRIRVDPRRT